MENENNVIGTETSIDVVDKNDKKEIDNQEFCDDIENPEEIKPAKKQCF